MKVNNFVEIERSIVFGNMISEEEAMANVVIVAKGGSLEKFSHLLVFCLIQTPLFGADINPQDPAVLLHL